MKLCRLVTLLWVIFLFKTKSRAILQALYIHTKALRAFGDKVRYGDNVSYICYEFSSIPYTGYLVIAQDGHLRLIQGQ